MHKALVIVACVLELLSPSLGEECGTLSGKWYNQLGSELILEESEPGIVHGEFRTAVEKSPGSAGGTHASVNGILARLEPSVLYGFSTFFNGGNSVTSWLGQCFKCGREETLRSTWLLRRKADSCSEQWFSTLVNEDVFIRREKVPGPRKDRGTHFPDRPSDFIFDAPPQGLKSRTETHSNINGKWYTDDGIELELTVDNVNGTIEGIYRSGSIVSMKIRGAVSPDSPSGVFGLQAIEPTSQHVYVWVGQYQTCADGKEILDSSWLRRRASPTCDRDLEATTFGRMVFVRTPASRSHLEGNTSNFSSVFTGMASKISNFFSNLFSR